ncbi:beta-ketoacyl-[acyl-carrier-protein] synthase II [Thalassotalea sp. HSM 43]|uniref:beta-ketoacyl-ACP synthase II n=1 Tax=Thalassotalea sp. HSM 43 TaxID=2552945 RepID=UPI00108038FE|nr:beta-ketoacyl-ACP synthase II [Thalassotalea sp. HSM 43]QBY05795.1 beta-ketoacyl-[acyl-carrier-protein] synthase II [Thalassotalea sp. HSM 43]
MRRVVVTGLGMLSPLANDAQSTWQALMAGKSGIGMIEHLDTTDFSTKFAGLVKDFNSEDFGIAKKEARKMDLFIQYGIAAGNQALADSGLEITEQNAGRVGVAVGSGIGGLTLIEEGHKKALQSSVKKLSPFFCPSTILNMISGHLSIMHGMKGPNIAIVTACTTGVHNIGHAARMIAYGDADAMLAGGAEKASTVLGIGGFMSARALSTRNDAPQQASRPWDKDRDGFVLSDGAGVVMIEEYEHAKARGANIYAELVGFGMSGDAHHITSPPANGEGGAAAMSNALKDANIAADKVGYINAHGTSTPAGDIAETNGAKSVFGDHAHKLMMGSTKSMTGHMLGAAGSAEAIFTILSLQNQEVPPTINLDNPDEGCDLDYIAHTARQATLDYALCNSFGFGGTNGSLLFKKI